MPQSPRVCAQGKNRGRRGIETWLVVGESAGQELLMTMKRYRALIEGVSIHAGRNTHSLCQRTTGGFLSDPRKKGKIGFFGHQDNVFL